MSEYIRARVKAIIESNGQTLTYRRTTSASRTGNLMSRTNTVSDTAVFGHLRQYKPSEMSGLVQQGDRELRIAAGSLSFTPRANDTIINGSVQYKIISVDTRVKDDVPLEHIMQGDLDELISALQTHDKEQRLKNL